MNLLPQLVELWTTRLKDSAYYPDPNCWTSLIEALSRGRRYEQAFEIVGTYLDDCVACLQGKPNKVAALPDLKFARCCVWFLGNLCLGTVAFFNLKLNLPETWLPQALTAALREESRRTLSNEEVIILRDSLRELQLEWKRQSGNTLEVQTPQTHVSASAPAPSRPASSSEAQSSVDLIRSGLEGVESPASSAESFKDLLAEEPHATSLQLNSMPLVSRFKKKLISFSPPVRTEPDRHDIFDDDPEPRARAPPSKFAKKPSRLALATLKSRTKKK